MTSPSPSPSGSDWPAEVAGRIESVVGSVRDKTTVPAIRAAEALVYGVVLAVLGTLILIVLVILVIRLLDLYLPIHPLGRRVWITDAIISAIFLSAGLFMWRRRLPRGA